MCVSKCFRLYSLVLVVSCVRLKLFYSFAKIKKQSLSDLTPRLWLSFSFAVLIMFISCQHTSALFIA